MATYKEIQFIKKLAPKVAEEFTNGYLSEGDPQIAIHHNALPNITYFVMIEDDTLKGWIAFGEGMDPFTFDRTGFINEIYVFSRFRKNGIGRKLLEKTMEHLETKGFKKVQLNVFAGNSAQKLYYQLGFTSVSTLMEKYLD
jgi:ribosomal protein S18 acetylase RimI-like enzyme